MMYKKNTSNVPRRTFEYKQSELNERKEFNSQKINKNKYNKT